MSGSRFPRTFWGAVLWILCTSANSAQGIDMRTNEEVVGEGERLVHNMDCHVCHTPKVMTPEGPRPDPARLLSGHPADEHVPSWPESTAELQGWGGLFSVGLTAWRGPWGTSFAANLTPDEQTGIGTWSLDDFMASMRGGFSPPMPTYSRLTDAELFAIFSYLRSLEPVGNEVPGGRVP